MAGQELVSLEDNLVLECEQHSGVGSQCLTHGRVTPLRGRFVVVVREDGIGIEFGRQPGNGIARDIVKHDQAAARIGQRPA
ncbi:hypothetical protein D3C72_2401030 [compost metagenome]